MYILRRALINPEARSSQIALNQCYYVMINLMPKPLVTLFFYFLVIYLKRSCMSWFIVQSTMHTCWPRLAQLGSYILF